MNLNDIKTKIQSKEYSFLKDNEFLGRNVALIGLGGSYAYGTNNDESDIDIRGVATNTRRNILIGEDFEQVVETNTDTTIYSFDKIIKLLCSCNPNVIEILGLKPEHYLYTNCIGRELLNNKTLFLSKRAINSFGGYANAQLRRLENKSARKTSQQQQEQYILRSIECAAVDYKRKYLQMPDDAIKLYIDKSLNPELDVELFMDANISHYPLRDYRNMLGDMENIIRSFNKFGARNKKAVEHNKLGKHMCHLIRLYLMVFDILEKGEINTYREKEHDFLMAIRNGKYLNGNEQPIKEFYEIVDEYENRLKQLQRTTDLPENADMNKVLNFVEKVNEMVVYGGVMV